MAKNQDAPQTIYRLKLWLCDLKPLIWRRIEVPSIITLPKLHRAIQVAMGWEDYHLHAFHIGRISYEIPDPEEMYPSKARDERRVKLLAVVATVGTEFGYVYDFGDGWEHRLLLEAIALAEPGVFYPRCVQGDRSGPPEDAGGTGGYEDYLNALADPNHDQHDELLAWRGPFDPERFDREAVNRALRKEFSPKARQRSSG
jgi:hypothetical protein